MGFISKGLKNEFETAVVNEPSVFEPLKFYCTSFDDEEFCTKQFKEIVNSAPLIFWAV